MPPIILTSVLTVTSLIKKVVCTNLRHRGETFGTFSLSESIAFMKPKSVRIDGVDQRKGMGIGGWDIVWTATHDPSGCSVTWRTCGGEPETQHKMRDRALMALELLSEVYPDKTKEKLP